MKPNQPLRIIAGRLSFALAILLTVSCAASRSRQQHSRQQVLSTSTAEQTVQERSLTARQSQHRTAGQSIRHEVRTTTTEAVAAEEACLVVPLRAFDSLPEGAQFAVRNGRTSVAASRRGDGLVITARSDSLCRRVTACEQTDVLKFTVADSLTRYAADTSRHETLGQYASCADIRTETTDDRRTPARRGRWFVAGLALGALLVLLAYETGILRKIRLLTRIF